jgi:hypothetical protein
MSRRREGAEMETQAFTELAQRAGDGIVVSLMWSRTDNALRVSIANTQTGEEFELDAHPDNALDIYYHPFAYAAHRGLDYGPWTAVPPAGDEALAA